MEEHREADCGKGIGHSEYGMLRTAATVIKLVGLLHKYRVSVSFPLVLVYLLQVVNT